MASIDVTSVIDVDVDRVWAVVRDFNAMPNWHPFVARSRIEGGAPSDQVGCVRNFYTHDDGNIREQLLALSDLEHSFWYSILDSPMPMTNYVAGLSLKSISDGDRTLGRWQATFNCAPEVENDLKTMISTDVFQGGFNALKSRFGMGAS
ncbi:MAG: SRPBCC family protein [Pseudomonadota bacterium]